MPSKSNILLSSIVMLDWEVFVWGGEGERKLVFDWEVFVWFVFLGATRFFLSFVFLLSFGLFLF